jgi:hypothetical protein
MSTDYSNVQSARWKIYEIFSEGTLIGHTLLELADPPMGVVFGKFMPAPRYGTKRHLIASTSEDEPTATKLKIQDPQTLDDFTHSGTIIEFENDAYIEIIFANIPNEVYQRWFQPHVLEYQKRFQSET